MNNTKNGIQPKKEDKKAVTKKISPTIVVIKANDSEASLTIGTCHCSS